MHRKRLAANLCPGRQPAALDDLAAALGDVARQRHGDGRVAAQPFVDDGVEKGELVERRGRVGAQLLGQTALEVQRARLRQLPQDEAEGVAGGVDARGHVVQALGGHVDGLELGRLFLEAAHERKGRRVRALARLDDVVVGQGRLARLGKDVEQRAEDAVEGWRVVGDETVCGEGSV